MGRSLTAATPNSPPTRGTQDECFFLKRAVHTIIQLAAATNRKSERKTRPATQGIALSGAGVPFLRALPRFASQFNREPAEEIRKDAESRPPQFPGSRV